MYAKCISKPLYWGYALDWHVRHSGGPAVQFTTYYVACAVSCLCSVSKSIPAFMLALEVKSLTVLTSRVGD